MTKGKKTIIGCAIALAVLLLAGGVIIYADVMLTHIVDGKLRQRLSAMDSLTIRYGDLDILLGEGKIRLKDVVFSTDTTDTLSVGHAGVSVHIEKLEAGYLNVFRILRTRQVDIDYVEILRPEVAVVTVSKSKQNKQTENSLSSHESDSTNVLRKYISKIQVGQIIIEEGNFSLSTIDSRLHLSTEDVGLSMTDIAYSIEDKQLTYNDSIYSLSLKNLSLLTRDSLYALDLGALHHADAGEVVLENIHTRNTVDRHCLADRKGKQPVTWSNVSLKQVRISPLNLIRQAIAKQVSIDSISIIGQRAAIYRDMRYTPRSNYPMPQEKLMSIGIPLKVKHLKMRMPSFEAEVLRPAGKAGKLIFTDVTLATTDISNANGNCLNTHVQMKMAGGEADMSLTLTNDKACNLSAEMAVTSIEGRAFDDFLRPMFGMSMQCDIGSMRASLSGDRRKLTGSLTMLYDNLQLHIYKEETPMERLAKNANVVNTLAPMVIYKSNPRPNKQNVYVCKISFERNPKKNFAGYLTGAVIDGMMHTALQESVYKSVKSRMQ